MRQRILKQLALIAIISTASTAYAVGPGFYVGLMAGPSTNSGAPQKVHSETGTPVMTTVTPAKRQFGTRIFMGNMINQYAGIEGGLTYFSSINYDAENNVEPCSGASARVRTIDIVGKGSYPFGSVDVYGKAGAAATYVTTSGGLNAPTGGDTCGKTNRVLSFRPSFAVGAGYDFNQSWVADFSWTRLMVGGIVKNVDLYAIGISYHFVDRYCGQFLCD